MIEHRTYGQNNWIRETTPKGVVQSVENQRWSPALRVSSNGLGGTSTSGREETVQNGEPEPALSTNEHSDVRGNTCEQPQDTIPASEPQGSVPASEGLSHNDGFFPMPMVGPGSASGDVSSNERMLEDSGELPQDNSLQPNQEFGLYTITSVAGTGNSHRMITRI
ncbi:hypothetical protein V6N11_077431 [Hibiscus sabdariffa]|uniref:Uncharacterized protein n=1 Tax=Hibiscus sabdariffa TaxID=183260 RepID=A0ABR2TDT3_9ROSI